MNRINEDDSLDLREMALAARRDDEVSGGCIVIVRVCLLHEHGSWLSSRSLAF